MHPAAFLLLALCPCAAVKQINGNIAGSDNYHNDAKTGIDRTRKYGALEDLPFTDSQTKLRTRRRKRSVTSFSDALNPIIASTIGFTKLNVKDKEMKLYVKVGSYVDATNDFYSLRPYSVTHISPRLITGAVEGHAVGLRSQPPTLYILNERWANSKQEETIVQYFNSVREAKSALRNWGVFSSLQ